MNCGINGSIAAHNSLLILRVPMFQGYSDHGLITIATVWFLPCRRHFGDQVRRLRGAQLVSDGPRQQFVDAIDRMVGDEAEHVAQVRLGVDAVELAGADQGVQRRGALAALVQSQVQIEFLRPRATARSARSAALFSALRRPSFT